MTLELLCQRRIFPTYRRALVVACFPRQFVPRNVPISTHLDVSELFVRFHQDGIPNRSFCETKRRESRPAAMAAVLSHASDNRGRSRIPSSNEFAPSETRYGIPSG